MKNTQKKQEVDGL